MQLEAIQEVKNAVIREAAYNEVPSRIYKRALQKNSNFRRLMVDFSLNEYDENPYYKTVIKKWSSSITGPFPSIIAMSDDDESNNAVEDGYHTWGLRDKVGFAYRELTRMAALTGIGIGMQSNKSNDEDKEIGLTYKIYGTHHLKTPTTIPVNSPGYNKDFLHECIQYDKNWNILGFWIEEVYYDEKDLIYWYVQEEDGKVCLTPPCGQSFTIYPSIKRIVEAVVKGEEFRAAIPLAVEVDGNIWGQGVDKSAVPNGRFKYEPGFIPTLPPGTKLAGVPGAGTNGGDQEKIIRLVASSAALSIDMPANLALGDSSNSNMSSSQVDMQPWRNKIDVDRFDIQHALYRSFYHWYKRAIRIRGALTSYAKERHKESFPFTFAFQNLFSHPDPNKVSNSRMVDLKSGYGTLSRYYSENGMNPKRELAKEAKLLGYTYNEYVQAIMTSRNNYVQQGIYDDEEKEDQTSQDDQE